MNFNLDGNSFLLSLLIGSIGFVSFAYGKRQHRAPQLGVGLVLMIYPYFVTSLVWTGAIAVALLGGLALLLRLGL